MSNLIKILEKIGRDSHLQVRENLAAMLETSNLDENVIDALLTNDKQKLETYLNVKSDFFCGIVPAEDDEPSKEDEEPKKEENETKSAVNQ